jgi:hypothetical protein
MASVVQLFTCAKFSAFPETTSIPNYVENIVITVSVARRPGTRGFIVGRDMGLFLSPQCQGHYYGLISLLFSAY